MTLGVNSGFAASKVSRAGIFPQDLCGDPNSIDSQFFCFVSLRLFSACPSSLVLVGICFGFSHSFSGVLVPVSDSVGVFCATAWLVVGGFGPLPNGGGPLLELLLAPT